MNLPLIVSIGVLVSAVLPMPCAHAADRAQELYREALAAEQALRAEVNPPPDVWRSTIRQYEAIVRRAREAHLAGATVLRGPMGFGRHSRVHTAKLLQRPGVAEVIAVIGYEAARMAEEASRAPGILSAVNERYRDGMLSSIVCGLDAAHARGADAVLLIVAILDPALLHDLLAAAKGLGLAALVECHTAAELDQALAAGSRILGINNRDLRTFETRVETSLALLPRVPPGPVVVSESGFQSGADVRRVIAAGAHAVLVGEGLVRAADVAAKIGEFKGG